MNINLTITNFVPDPNAVSYNVSYARIDNTSTPVYTAAGTFTATQLENTESIANVPNGEYTIKILPVYANGRVCTAALGTTPSCQNIIALNAVNNGSGSMEITYTAAGSVPQVYLTVTYPNGGTYTGAYTNGANNSTILIPFPTSGGSPIQGTYLVYMQSICDPATGFYSAATAPVSVVISGSGINITGTTSISNSTSPLGGTITASPGTLVTVNMSCGGSGTFTYALNVTGFGVTTGASCSNTSTSATFSFTMPYTGTVNWNATFSSSDSSSSGNFTVS